MQKETASKKCIVCDVDLTDANWLPSQRKNWINKCADCLRKEKREYANAWRIKHPERAAENQRRHKEFVRINDPVKARARSAYSDCRKRAIKQGMPFDLTGKHVLQAMRDAKVCPYFGWPLTFEVGKERTLASIDRIDSNRGYTKDNIQVISYLANLMKSYATEEELIAFSRGVLSKHDTESLPSLYMGLRTIEKVKGKA